MSVVQIGPLVEDGIGSATLPFAFRNNTSEGISHVDWTGTARSGGSIVATGSSQGTIRRALIVYESESVCRDRTVAERLRNEASRLLRLAEALPPPTRGVGIEAVRETNGPRDV